MDPGMRRFSLVSNVLIAAGVLLLGLSAAHVVAGLRAQATRLPENIASPSAPRPAHRPAEGEALGRLEVPRLGLDLVVFEGASESVLRKGPGHLPGTAWPGGTDGAGNCVITGHRDSFFRRLAAARKDDLVRLHGPSGASTYRLETRRIVRPRDLSVIAPTPDDRLTLITCYPFRWVGSAPYRLAWSAVRLESASTVENTHGLGRPSH
jgi:sortase A